jgi:hypothetical protein
MDTCLDTKLGALCSTNGIIKKRNRFNLTDKDGQSPIKIIETPEGSVRKSNVENVIAHLNVGSSIYVEKCAVRIIVL